MTIVPPPGLHRLTDAEYFAIDLPSASQTKTLATGTNAHLAHERENPREDTDAFAVGAYVHALLLAPDTIDTAFVRMRPVDRRTKEGKAEHDAALRRAETNGARLITDAQVAEAEAMAASVRGNPSAAVLLNTLTHHHRHHRRTRRESEGGWADRVGWLVHRRRREDGGLRRPR